MKPSKLRRGLFIAAAAIALSGSICPNLGEPGPLATMMIYLPGNDTVLVDIESGVVSSGPITMFGDTDFSTEFFTTDGSPDSRITENLYRLDVTPANTGIVTFSRVTAFSGTLNKIASGNTQVQFRLITLQTQESHFNHPVDVTVN